MTEEFAAVYAALAPVLKKYAKRLALKEESEHGLVYNTKIPSLFPQHKGHPMFFGGIRVGKAYVSFHLMPLYMCPDLIARISPQLKKRMQGKSCFNFKTVPEPELLNDLKVLVEASVQDWTQRNWL